MKLPEHERQAHREAFRAMSLAQKAEYIFAYYKLPLVIALVAAVALGSVLKYQLTHKDALLYVAYANVELAEEDDRNIFDGFLKSQDANPRTTEVYRYYGLYLTDPEGSVDHQYSYASRLKLTAAIDAEQLDVVLMNQEAYDLLSHSGYLADLQTTVCECNPDLLPQAGPLICGNDVIIKDNQVELDLGEADAYEAVTEQHGNAFDVSELPAFRNLGLSDRVYLGIIGNTPRRKEALDLVSYLLNEG